MQTRVEGSAVALVCELWRNVESAALVSGHEFTRAVSSAPKLGWEGASSLPQSVFPVRSLAVPPYRPPPRFSLRHKSPAPKLEIVGDCPPRRTIPFAFQGRISREARHQSWKVKGLFEISAKGNATAREGPGKTGSTDTPGMETSLDRS